MIQADETKTYLKDLTPDSTYIVRVGKSLSSLYNCSVHMEFFEKNEMKNDREVSS